MCTQGRFSLDAAFEGAECRCIPTFSVIGYPGGTSENWLYQGHHIAHAQGTAYLEYYFVVYDTREGMDYSAWDPIALGAPDKVTLVIEGTAYAQAIRNVFGDGCSSVSLTETVLDQTLSVSVRACEPSPGEWERRDLDTVRKILPLEWRFLGYAPPEFNNVEAHVWKAEIAVPFNSQGEWFVPFSTGNCYYYYGSAAGNIGITVCPVLRGMSLHLPTYRKGANNRPEPNPPGEGDIGVDVQIMGSFACVSSREMYIADLWGDWSQHTTCEWQFSPAPLLVSRSYEYGCGYEVIHENDQLFQPGSCFPITNQPSFAGHSFPLPYTLTCTATDNEDGYTESDTFRMRLHYPIEPKDIVKSVEIEPCHGQPVSSWYYGKYAGNELNACIEMEHSISFSWGVGGELSVSGVAKLVLGGTVTMNFSQETFRANRTSACFKEENPRRDMKYVIMAAPAGFVEVWKCDLYDRMGYAGQGEICRWKPIWSDQFPDGTIMDGRPSDLAVGLVAIPVGMDLKTWQQEYCPKLPCPMPGEDE